MSLRQLRLTTTHFAAIRECTSRLQTRAPSVRIATHRPRARSRTDCRPQQDNARARSPKPTARRWRGCGRAVRRTTSWSEHDRGRAGPSPRHAASTTPASSSESVRRLCRESERSGWWISSTRKASAESCDRMPSSASSCACPSHPVAISGGVGTAEETPISARGPRRRTNGNATGPAVTASSPRR